MKTKKRISILLAAVMILGVMSGCGTASGASADETREIIIGAGSAYRPYWYLDENDELTGFEKAVLDEIESRLPGYTFTYQVSDFSNILLSLESGKIDVAVHQFEYNIERDAKYLYGTEGYTTFPLFLAVREDEEDITTFDDLAGRRVICQNTTNNGYYITNKWNEEHGNPFEIVFSTTTQLIIEDLENGVGDAILTMARNVEDWQKEYNARIKVVGAPVSNSNAYYLFNRDTGEELQELFDDMLRELKEDGTLSRLSEEWLGGDYIVKD